MIAGSGFTASAEMANPEPSLPGHTVSTLYARDVGLVRPLRVVLIAPHRIPGWLVQFIDLAARNDWLEVIVLSLHESQCAPPELKVSLGMRAMMAFEQHRGVAEPAFTVTSLAGRQGIAFEPPLSERDGIAEVLERLPALQPHLLLLLGPQSWVEPLSGHAEWGCWLLDSTLTNGYRAAEALLPALVNGDSATSVELELQPEGSAAITLARSSGATCRALVIGQREHALRKLPPLLLRSLRQLLSDEAKVPRRRAARLLLGSLQPRANPAAGARALVSILGYRLAARRRRLTAPEGQWAVVLRQDAECLDPLDPQLMQGTILHAPRGKYWADPCAVIEAGRRLLFVEECPTDDDKGVIACLQVSGAAQVQRLGVALEQPFHLSYPQVFPWQGQWFMTVESGRARCVSLYRCDAFPLGWQHVADLLEGWVFVDPTLHFHEGRWYLFVNVAESGGSTCDDLFLFVADRLEGPYRPHQTNPIVGDAGRARMAGRLFVHGERLIRPAQDCAESYGSAIVFHEVLELSPTIYRERPLGRLGASAAGARDGCHTYSAAGGLEVVDVRGVNDHDARFRARAP